MNRFSPNRITIAAFAVLALLVCGGSVRAIDIPVTISSTLTITEDSQLTDDVTCTQAVKLVPCIIIGASGVSLSLNGHTITGPVNPLTSLSSCSFPGAPSFGVGIEVNGQTHVTIKGPGGIQYFQRWGILLVSSTEVTVKDVTANFNCWSGLQTIVVSDSSFEGNVWANNALGSHKAACGGICLVDSNNNAIRKSTFNGNGAIVDNTTGVPDPSGTRNNNFGVGFEGTSSGNHVERNDMGGNVNGVLVFATASGNVIRDNTIVGNPSALVSETFTNGPGADIHDLHAFSGANTFEDNFCLTYLGPSPAPCPNIGVNGDEQARNRLTSPLKGQEQSNSTRTTGRTVQIISGIASFLAVALGLGLLFTLVSRSESAPTAD